jgi:cellulose biosynthesis protein BcsQ
MNTVSKKIVLAGADEKYILTIEEMLATKFSDLLELEVITSADYFDEYFGVHRDMEILLISDEMYDEKLLAQTVNCFFVLTEDVDREFDPRIKKLFKYIGVSDLYNEIRVAARIDVSSSSNGPRRTQLITFFSGIGGSGKTTLSIAAAAALSDINKKAIFVSCEEVNTFHRYVEDGSPLSAEAIKDIQKAGADVYNGIKHNIRREYTDYLPPFPASLSTLGISLSGIVNLIKSMQRVNVYDYIVVDLGDNISDEYMEILARSDKVVFVVLQDAFSVFKMNEVLKNVDLSDSSKTIYICNRFRDDRENHIMSSSVITEYIGDIEGIDKYKIGELKENPRIKELGFLLEA